MAADPNSISPHRVQLRRTAGALTRDEDRRRRADRIWALHPIGAHVYGCKRKLKRARRISELLARSQSRDRRLTLANAQVPA